MSEMQSYGLDDVYIESTEFQDIKKTVKQIDDVLRTTYAQRFIRTEDICNGLNSNILQMFEMLNKEFQDMRRSIEELRLTVNMRLHSLEKNINKKAQKQNRKCFSIKRCLGCVPQ